MKIEISSDTIFNDVTRKTESLSGHNLLSCRQCSRCPAGCPGTSEMNILPNNNYPAHKNWENRGSTEFRNDLDLCILFYMPGKMPADVDLAKIMEALRAKA